MKNELLTIEDALALDIRGIRGLYKRCGNPALTNLLRLLEFDKRFVRARSAVVWDEKNNEYLDFLGGYGALNVGHNHPRVLEALNKVTDVPGLIQTSLPPVAAALANNLAAVTPGELQRTFFCNSGAEAVEGALKLARAATGRPALVFCDNSFHGKTMGALSVTGREKYRKPFTPLVPDCHAVPFGDADELEIAVKRHKPAAFIVEPVQGEGGIIVPPAGYLAQASDICKRYGTLLVVDEIQTGFGRTGKMFACEHENVTPDVMCMAKSLGGGILPIGAFITTDALWKKAYSGIDRATLHTSTFGGNSMAAAAGLAALEVILQEDLPAAAREKGRLLLELLKALQHKLPIIREVRGQGLLIGIEFNQPPRLVNTASFGIAKRLSHEFIAGLVASELVGRHRIITAYTLNNPNVIRLEPPLTVSEKQLYVVTQALEHILSTHKGFFSIATSRSKAYLRTLLE